VREGVDAPGAVAVRAAAVEREGSFWTARLRGHESHRGGEGPSGYQVVVNLVVGHAELSPSASRLVV
jgi:hypothetical protein